MDDQREPALQVGGIPQRAALRVLMVDRQDRRVFADAPLRESQLVERSPVLVIPNADRAATDRTIVLTYVSCGSMGPWRSGPDPGIWSSGSANFWAL